MLRKIPTHQLSVGMFVHEVPGSWLSHPFWRASFKLTDARQIEQLRQAVGHVVIDTGKGPDAQASAITATYLDDVEVEMPPEGSGEVELPAQAAAPQAPAAPPPAIPRSDGRLPAPPTRPAGWGRCRRS